MPIQDPFKPKNSPAQQSKSRLAGVHDPFSPGYTLPPPKPTHETADYLKLLGVGAGQLARGVGFLADKATGGASDQFFENNVGRSLTDIGGDVAEYYRSQLSPAMQESMNKEFISSQPGEVFGEALTDPHAIAGTVVQSLPLMVPGIGIAGKAGSVAGNVARSAALARGATQAAARKAGIRAGGRAATAAGGVTEGGISGGLVGADVEQRVLNSPEEVLQTSPYYQTLRQQGMSPREARAATATQAGESAALKAGALTGLLGSYFNNYLGRLAAGGGRTVSRTRGALGAGGAEAATEAAQSGQESYQTQQALHQFAGGPEVNWQEVANQAVGGFVAGGVLGAGVGALAPEQHALPPEPRTEPPPPPSPPSAQEPPALPPPSPPPTFPALPPGNDFVVFPNGTVAEPNRVERVIDYLRRTGRSQEARRIQQAFRRAKPVQQEPTIPVEPRPPGLPPIPPQPGEEMAVGPQGGEMQTGETSPAQGVEVAPNLHDILTPAELEQARRRAESALQETPEQDQSLGSAPDVPRAQQQARGGLQEGETSPTPRVEASPPLQAGDLDTFERDLRRTGVAVSPIDNASYKILGNATGGFDVQRTSSEGQREVIATSPNLAQAQESAIALGSGQQVQATAINQAANEAATSPTNNLPEPTEAQQKAGNYRKGHARINGLDVSIENPQGSTRSGVDPGGQRWERELTHHYGYLRGTQARDGEPVDVFLGPQAQNPDLPVFVVDQVEPETGKFDEPKVMMGFPDEQAAREGYLSNYEPGWQGLGAITPMSLEDFKQWVRSPAAKKPVSKQLRQTKALEETPSVESDAPQSTEIDQEESTEVPTKPTQEAAAATQATTPPVATEPAKTTPDLTIETLSPQSIIVKGNTKAHKDRIKSLRGLWNRKHQGWIFPKTREAQVREALADLVSPAPIKTQTTEEVGKTEQPPTAPAEEGIPSEFQNLKRGDRVRVSDGAQAPKAPENSAIDRLALLIEQSPVTQLNSPEHAAFQDLRQVLDQLRRGGVLTSNMAAIFERASQRLDRNFSAQADVIREAVEDLGQQQAQKPKADPKRPADYGKNNKIFTEDAAAKAREVLRKKLGQLNSGIDPEIMQAGITLAGFHIESGARKFADYAQAMIADLGQGIRPFLKSFYVAVRNWPGFDPKGMDEDSAIDAFLERTPAQEDTTEPAPKTLPVPVENETTTTLENGASSPLKALDLLHEIAAMIRHEKQWRFDKEGNNYRLSTTNGDPIGVLPTKPRHGNEATDLMGRVLAKKLQEEGITLPSNPEDMTLDELTLAYEGGVIPEFEVTSDDIGTLITTTGPAGTFQVNIRELYNKIQNQKESRADGREDLSPVGSGEIKGDRTGVASREPTGEGNDRLLEGAPAQDDARTQSDEDHQRTGARTGKSTRSSSGKKSRSRNDSNRREGASRQGLVDPGDGRDGPPDPARGNYVIADPESLIGGGPKVRFERNRKAIESYQAITEEGRVPTQEDLDALAGYIGWGSFGQELFQGTWNFPTYREGWKSENDWLREHLGKEAWESAQRSIINAHYTDPPTVTTVWSMVVQMGFKGGRVLEPSLGIGNFFGLMPQDLAAKSQLTGIELDKTTGGMANILYPNANVQIKGYQESQTADNFYDLVLGNWPFAKEGPIDRRYLKINPSLHDYFFLKAMDQVRPGGLVVGITSAGTMDKQGRLARIELAKKGELIAAFRLPTGAFEKYAGTKVVTDILVFRKRAEPINNVTNAGWIATVEQATPAGETIRVNEYWRAHPENILGEMTWGHGTTTGRPGMIVNRPSDFAERLAALPKRVPKETYQPYQPKHKVAVITNYGKDRENSVTFAKGDLYVVQGEHLALLNDLVPWRIKDTKETERRKNQIERLIGIRRAYGDLTDAERQGKADIESLRQALRTQYESFRETYGPINGSQGLRVLERAKDPFHPVLASLESNGEPAKILFESTTRTKKKLVNPSIRDALAIARNERVDVDMARVAELAKRSEEEVAKELLEAGAVFLTPEGNYEVADIYLSGNVRRKLREAKEAKEAGQDMARNIEALEKVVPKDVPYFQIEAKLGAGWVRPEQYQEFIAELLGVDSDSNINVRFALGSWRVRFEDKRLNHRPEARTQWGVTRYPFDQLVTAAMNNRSVTLRVKDENKNLVVDQEATQEVNEKISRLREEFSAWVWKDVERRIELERTYNEVMNAIATPHFDGSFLEFEGMALQRGETPFNLRKHQADAIWRGIANGRGIYAHEVGSGKAQPLDAKVLTPTGWRPMGDIQVGDQVITQTGEATTVEAVFPQGEKEIYRVAFSDGSSTECCEEHLWLTRTYRERNQAINAKRFGKDWGCAKPKARSLAEIRKTLLSKHLGAKNHSIPVVEPVRFESRTVPLDPYLIGVLLGDGGISQRSATISSQDEEIIQGLVLPENIELRRINHSGRCPSWALRMKRQTGFGVNRVPNPVVKALEQFSLMGKKSKDKFIPEDYLFNNIETRIALLQGLMDTDGSVSKNGHSVYFYTIADRLADDVTALVQSLGGTVNRATKMPRYRHNGETREGAKAYALCINLPPQINPFRLARKADRVKPKSKYLPIRYVVAVEPVGKKPAQCIRVAHPSHLYVTDDFIVTHNTYTMGGVAVESRRYGIARKPLILAHNANSASVAREIQEMYPAARVLYVDNLTPSTLQTTLRQIANDDWDAVVVPHSLIDRFAMSKETLRELMDEEIAALEQEAMDAAAEEGADLDISIMNSPDDMKKVRSRTAKELVHQRNAIINQIEKMAVKASREDAITFEDLGIDMIIVDEAHDFKKPPLVTKMKMKGLNKGTSLRSIQLRFLTDYVKKINNGRGVHVFTGTPITNTLAEIYNQMRYVMDDQMARDGIKDWDTWFNTFADSTSDVELTPTGEYEAVTRLAAFVNVAELRRLAGQYMDIVFADEMPEFSPRETASGKKMSDHLTEAEREELENGRTERPIGRPYKKVISDVAPMSPAQEDIMRRLVDLSTKFKNASPKERLEMVKSGHPASPVLVETAAANAGLDARLDDMDAPDHPDSKANRVVRNVLEHANEHPLATQVIFMERGYSDRSVRTKTGRDGSKTKTVVPKFNLVKDIVSKLVEGGMPREQIAVVDGKVSKEKRKEIADAMNRGEIRVVIGNTSTLGVGVNMQENLRAMHHMDAPWMPGELEQRNGRGWRQGNKWNTVLEYRYITERLDGRRWQVLMVKDRFIKAFLKADDSIRVIEGDAVDLEEDADNIAATLSEAAGDPRILMREKLKNDLKKLENRERIHTLGITEAKVEVRRLEAQIESAEHFTKRAAKDAAHYAKVKDQPFRMTVGKKTFDKRAEADEALKAATLRVEPGERVQALGEFDGFAIKARWPSRLSGMEMFVEREVEYPVKASTASIERVLRGLGKRVEDIQKRSEENRDSIQRLKESTQQPFAQQETLAKKRQMLKDIEVDLQNNPVPAPAWLRQGAPVGTVIYANGKALEVEGHRWGDGDYLIVTEQGEIPYLSAKDESGVRLYAPHEFTPRPNAGAKQEPTEAPKFSRGGQGRGVSTEALTTHANNLMRRWKNRPPVQVVSHFSQLPEEIQEEALKASDGSDIEGVWWKGRVYLVAENIENLERGETVILHEIRGHFGLRGMLGDKLVPVLNQVFRAYGKTGLREIAERYGLDLDTREGRLTAAEEKLAHMAQTGERPGILRQVYAMLRDWLRRMGFDLNLNNADLALLIEKSARFVEQGRSARQAIGMTLEPAFRREARFSRRPADLMEDMAAQIRRRPSLTEAVKHKIEDWRPGWLGTLTRLHLADVAQDILPQAKRYVTQAQQMDADRNHLLSESAEIATDWGKYQRKFKAESSRLSELMHDATIIGVDPAEPFVSQVDIPGHQAKIRELTQHLREAKTDRQKAKLEGNIKQLREAIAQERKRVRQYPVLKARYQALSAEGKDVYKRVRDHYSQRYEAVHEALQARIDRAKISGAQKTALKAKLRRRFESSRVAAPYFPLARFGDFWVQVKDGPEAGFYMFENSRAQSRFAREHQAQGREVVTGKTIENIRAVSGASEGFVSDVIGILDEAGLPQSSQMKDAIYQLYLTTLPDLSARKHFIHRKKTQGYNQDALRAFAKQTFHGAYQLARLKHSDILERELNAMREHIAESGDPNKASDLYQEFLKRHEWVMNPRGAAWSMFASSLGFVWYLGLTPAAAIVNTTQTPLVAFPVIASRHGWGKASRALNRAMGDYFKGGFDAGKSSGLRNELGGDTLRAMKELEDAGVLTRTLAHDLAGMSETDSQVYSSRHAKIMHGISFLFRHAELFNREVTALATYRLARAAGKTHEQAVVEARDTVYESHFDYGASNKARFMQNDAARVLLMFRQFSLNMSYLLARNAHQWMKGQTPAIRKEARAKLTGILGMHALAAGVMGMPLFSLVAGIMNAMLDDPDEPYDFKTEFRNTLADYLGPEAAEVIAKGPASAITGADISGRVSLDGLWFRTTDRDLEGRSWVEYWLEQLAGPLFGIAASVGTGYDLIQEGKVQRGIEFATPKVIKDGLRMLRFGTEGAQTLRGDPIMEDVGGWDSFLQGIGFRPSTLVNRRDANRAVKNLEFQITNRRQHLMNRYALAVRMQDQEGVQESLAAIRRFNRINPAAAITVQTLRRSLKTRARLSSQAQNGIILSKNLRGLGERVRFALPQ